MLREPGAAMWCALALLMALPPATRAQEGGRELALYLPFDEGRGRLARDGTGGLGHGILSADVQWTEGRFGHAVRFSGHPGSHVRLPLPAAWYREHQDALSVLAWVKPSGKRGEIIFGVHGPSDGRLYFAVDQGGRWAMGLGARPWGADETGARPVADEEWHAVAMVLDRGTATVYVDGEACVSKPYEEIGIGLDPVVGAASGAAAAFAFEGAVDELAVFQGALSQEEVRAAMAGLREAEMLRPLWPAREALVVEREGLVAEWGLDEGEGDVAFDTSGNGNAATLTGADWTEGVVGLAARFPARLWSTRMEADHAPSLGLDSGFTLACWLYWDPRGANWVGLFDKAPQVSVHLPRYSRNIHLTVATDAGTLSRNTGVKVPHYEWTHVAVTWSAASGQAAVYLDGRPAWREGLAGTALVPSDAALLIGDGRKTGARDPGGLAGVIDEVRVYNRALPAEAVAAEHEALAERAAALSRQAWVPLEPRYPPLEETTQDPETGALTYPAFPLLPSAGPGRVVFAGDFPSIQAAVESLPEEGGMVMVAPGRWEIDAPIVLRDNVALVGAGAATVIINRNGEGRSAIEATRSEQYRPAKYAWGGAKGHHGVVISRLQVRGNPDSGHGIYLSDSDHFIIEDCWVFFNGKSGVCLSYGEENNIVRGVISKWNGEHGLYIEGSHDTLITASHFEENRLDGIHVQQDNIQACIVGCNYEDNGRFGVYNKGRWTQIVGCQCDSNEGGADVFIGPESEYATVVSGSSGRVRAVGAYNVSVSGNDGAVHLVNCHSSTVGGSSGGSIILEQASRFNAVTGNVVQELRVGADCTDNVITGNVVRGALLVDGQGNAVAGNVGGGP